MVKVRLAQVQDARAIAEVHVRAWQKGDRGIRADSYLDSLSSSTLLPCWEMILSQLTTDEVFFVAETDDALVGFARGKPAGAEQVLELYQLNVDPLHGVGSALLDAFVDWAIQRGAIEAILWVASANSRARSFYEHREWKVDEATQTLTDEPHGVPVHESMYRRRLRAN